MKVSEVILYNMLYQKSVKVSVKAILTTTGCLITDPTKVEAFYAHLWWYISVFWIINRKITLLHLLSNPENGNFVIISMKF